MKQTLYDILGVTPDTSFEDIEIAYAKRFAVLRAETSWESNRLVMLNEAREVLSDPGKRAAYDASIAAEPARARAHNRSTNTEEHPRSYGKWLIVLVVLAGFAAIIATRDDATAPELPTATQVGDGSEPAEQSEALNDDSAVEVELPAAGEDSDSSESTAAQGVGEEPPEGEQVVPEESVDDADATALESETVAVSPIVGNWECFDPVTGRSSTVGFTAEGTYTMLQIGDQPQSYPYELVRNQVRLLDTNPPRAMQIGELNASKLVLRGAVEGRSIVCSR
jgi:hypothetical protein